MGNFLTKQPPKIHTVKFTEYSTRSRTPTPSYCYLVINLIIQRRGYLIIIAKYHKQTK